DHILDRVPPGTRDPRVHHGEEPHTYRERLGLTAAPVSAHPVLVRAPALVILTVPAAAHDVLAGAPRPAARTTAARAPAAGPRPRRPCAPATPCTANHRSTGTCGRPAPR